MNTFGVDFPNKYNWLTSKIHNFTRFQWIDSQGLDTGIGENFLYIDIKLPAMSIALAEYGRETDLHFLCLVQCCTFTAKFTHEMTKPSKSMVLGDSQKDLCSKLANIPKLTATSSTLFLLIPWNESRWIKSPLGMGESHIIKSQPVHKSLTKWGIEQEGRGGAEHILQTAQQEMECLHQFLPLCQVVGRCTTTQKPFGKR